MTHHTLPPTLCNEGNKIIKHFEERYKCQPVSLALLHKEMNYNNFENNISVPAYIWCHTF